MMYKMYIHCWPTGCFEYLEILFKTRTQAIPNKKYMIPDEIPLTMMDDQRFEIKI